jgi:hypothetical protein
VTISCTPRLASVAPASAVAPQGDPALSAPRVLPLPSDANDWQVSIHSTRPRPDGDRVETVCRSSGEALSPDPVDHDKADYTARLTMASRTCPVAAMPCCPVAASAITRRVTPVHGGGAYVSASFGAAADDLALCQKRAQNWVIVRREVARVE